MTDPPIPAGRRFARQLYLHGEDYLLLAMLAVLFVNALAGAFSHMHDWTIDSIDEALREVHAERGGVLRHTPDWFGWTNAMTSEIMPSAALLMIRKRQRQGRPIGTASALFVGSAVLSILAQLSATGTVVPYAAQILVCLPVLALTVLAVFKFSDMSFARERAAAAEAEAELTRTRAARAAELKAERQAELAAAERRKAAELAAAEAERQAELERAERRAAAELAAELERRRIEAEQAGMTERARIEAEQRAAERAARERRELQAAEAERRRLDEAARAEAARVEAEAAVRRAAVERVAAARREQGVGGSDDEAARDRRRRPAAETAALVNDVLATLPAGTERPAAVMAVAEQLNVTAEYARRFVPAGYVAPGSPAASSAASSGEGSLPAGTSSGARLHLVGSSSA